MAKLPATSGRLLSELKRIAPLAAALRDTREESPQETSVATLEKTPAPFSTKYLDGVERALTLYVKRGDTSEAYLQLVRQGTEELRQDLFAGRDVSTISAPERLLIEWVIACHVALSRAETEAVAASKSTVVTGGGRALAASEFYARNFDRAHKRYLQTIKTLAEVRRLQVPSVNVALPGVVQINQGDKQINVKAGE